MKAWFDRLTPREKVLLAAVLPLIAAVTLYQFAWVPLTELRNAQRAQIAAYQLVAETAALSDVDIVQSAPQNDTPIATRITGTADAAGLPLRRIESEGAGMRVLLDDVPFAGLMLWLAELETAQGVTARAVEIDRRPAPGMVSARLLLEPVS